MTSSSSRITSSAPTQDMSLEFLAITPPINAPAPAIIRLAPSVEPISPTVAAAPIKPHALPTISGESILDIFSFDLESTGNSTFDLLCSMIYFKDSSKPF